jgi:branched-chain amino acid transport system substrate-binding protein
MQVRNNVGLNKYPIRSVLVAVTVTAVSLTLAACSSSGKSGSSSPGGSGDIVIGAVAAETGLFGAYGLGDVKGFEAQVDLINKAGGIMGHKLKLVTYDDQSDPAKAVIGVQKLLSMNPRPTMIHCGAISADCAPLLPYTGRAKVITMTAAATQAFTDPKQNPYNFVVFPSADLQTAANIALIKQVGTPDKVGIISGTDTGNKAILGAYKKAFPAGGLNIVKNEEVDPASVDMTAQLQALRSAGVKTLVAQVQATNFVTIMTNIQSIGWSDVKVLAGTTAVNDSVLGHIPDQVKDQFIALGTHSVTRTGDDNSGLSQAEQALIAQMHSLGAPFSFLLGSVNGADEINLIKWAAETAKSVKTEDIYNQLNNLGISTVLPSGLLMSVPHPNWSATNHGLAGADFSRYWTAIKPSASVDGTYQGTVINLPTGS